MEDDGNDTAANLFKKRVVSSQATFNSIFKKNLREDACLDISFFFYNNAIAFNVAKSEEFCRMLEKFFRHGLGFKPPFVNMVHELESSWYSWHSGPIC